MNQMIWATIPVMLISGLLSSRCAPSIHSNCYPQSLPFGGGAGTPSNPYTICTLVHLQNVAQNLSSSFLMTRNIDLTNSGLTPFGSKLLSRPFSGTFDGGGNSLLNWTYSNTTTSDSIGLFSYVTGTIQNLNLVNFQIAGLQLVGILVGQLNPTGVIQNVSTSGTVSGINSALGGVIGNANGGTINNCSSSATVNGLTGAGYCGGIIGLGGSFLMSHTVGTGTLSCLAGKGCGGLIGTMYSGTISTSYFAGLVQGAGYSGGLIGTVTTGTATAQNSYSTGTIQCTSGGSVGGGLVGQTHFAPASIILNNVYAAGPVLGCTVPGGLLGQNAGTSATSTSSYWDTQVTTQSSSDDVGSYPELTSAMQTQSTYSGWDFVNTWYPPVLGSSYPTLR